MSAARTAPLPVSPASAATLPVARPRMAPLEAIAPYIERIDAARWYSNRGPLICELEARLSARCAGAAAVSVANATQGIALTLRALAPAGGLCLMPGFTFVATAHAALQAGLTPYFMDIDPASLTATPETIRAALARAPERPAAIVAVSPFGAPLDAAALAALSRDLAVPIVLDAAAAFDSVSSAPTPTIVSLHATKVLGAGEGGFVLGAPGLIDEVRAATNFGFMGVREAAMPATNAKMSEYAAAVALAGLDTWETTRARFLMAARKLRIAAFRAPHIEFQRGWGERWITSTCVVRTVSGDWSRLAAHLAARDIASCRWYGAGLHREPAFAGLPRGDLTNVERAAETWLGIPFAIDMSDEDIARLAAALMEF